MTILKVAIYRLYFTLNIIMYNVLRNTNIKKYVTPNQPLSVVSAQAQQ